MANVLLTNWYPPEIRKIISEGVVNDFNLIFIDRPGTDGVLDKIELADYLLVGGRTKIDALLLANAYNLKMVQRSGVGLDSIDLNHLNIREIPLYVNKGINSRSVAEHTIMFMLALLRKLTIVDSTLKSGTWLKHELGMETFELANKTVGLIGMGSIGKYVAKFLKVFDANVKYYKRIRLSHEEEMELGIEYTSFEKILESSDIVSLHCPLNAQTENLIGSSELALMKKGAYIVNTSRGPLINENALINAVKTGHIRGAGLDVYAVEPLLPDSPILGVQEIITTPHISGVTRDSFLQMMKDAFYNIDCFHKGHFTQIADKRVI